MFTHSSGTPECTYLTHDKEGNSTKLVLTLTVNDKTHRRQNFNTRRSRATKNASVRKRQLNIMTISQTNKTCNIHGVVVVVVGVVVVIVVGVVVVVAAKAIEGRCRE